MRDYDAIFIGAGHNWLTCACYLARTVMRVRVVEANDVIGGMTTRELARRNDALTPRVGASDAATRSIFRNEGSALTLKRGQPPWPRVSMMPGQNAAQVTLDEVRGAGVV